MTEVIEYTEEEIEQAQKHLDLYSNRSSFWDSPIGQETLRIAKQYKLESTTTNEARCRIHNEMMANWRREFDEN